MAKKKFKITKTFSLPYTGKHPTVTDYARLVHLGECDADAKIEIRDGKVHATWTDTYKVVDEDGEEEQPEGDRTGGTAGVSGFGFGAREHAPTEYINPVPDAE